MHAIVSGRGRCLRVCVCALSCQSAARLEHGRVRVAERGWQRNRGHRERANEIRHRVEPQHTARSSSAPSENRFSASSTLCALSARTAASRGASFDHAPSTHRYCSFSAACSPAPPPSRCSAPLFSLACASVGGRVPRCCLATRRAASERHKEGTQQDASEQRQDDNEQRARRTSHANDRPPDARHAQARSDASAPSSVNAPTNSLTNLPAAHFPTRGFAFSS